MEQQDTYMKLINVNTFESEDYGIGLRRSSSQPLKTLKSPPAKKKVKKRGQSQDGSGDLHDETLEQPQPQELGKKKLIVSNECLA
jgi:hypothetical protein